jgi:hypothetical protein
MHLLLLGYLFPALEGLFPDFAAKALLRPILISASSASLLNSSLALAEDSQSLRLSSNGTHVQSVLIPSPFFWKLCRGARVALFCTYPALEGSFFCLLRR